MTGIRQLLRQEALAILARPEHREELAGLYPAAAIYDLTTVSETTPAAQAAHQILQTKKIGKIEAIQRYQSAIYASQRRADARQKLASSKDNRKRQRADSDA